MAIDYLQLARQNKYVYSLTILVLFYLLSKLVVLISQKIILKITKKTKTEVDDLIVRKTNRPISFILLFIGIRLALLPLGLRQSLTDVFEHIILTLIILTITYIAIALLDVIIDNWGRKVAEKTRSSMDTEMIPLLHKISRISLFFVGLLFVFPVWGIQIGPLLASLGIAGIAVAFALQNTLGNIFGGMSILLDKSIKVGDKIKLDADTMGEVREVGLRSTKILTFDNELVTIPNGKLADSKILNFMLPQPKVRVAIDFGVEYGSNPDNVRKIVLGVIKSTKGAIKEPEPKVLMMEMGDFALKFRAIFWVDTFDMKFDVKAFATEEIYKALTKEKIVIPFPTRTVYLRDEKKKSLA